MRSYCAHVGTMPPQNGSGRTGGVCDATAFRRHALPARVAGADLFVSECTYAQPGFEYHLNYELLLEHFHGFDCGRVLLTHLGAQMAHRRGQCEIETADDGLQLKL